MADTADETLVTGSLTITYSGAGGNYDSSTHFPAGLKVLGIAFVASNAADVLTIRNGSATGPKVYIRTGSGYDFLFGANWKPFITLTDCTYNTIANVSISFLLA